MKYVCHIFKLPAKWHVSKYELNLTSLIVPTRHNMCSFFTACHYLIRKQGKSLSAAEVFGLNNLFKRFSAKARGVDYCKRTVTAHSYI